MKIFAYFAFFLFLFFLMLTLTPKYASAAPNCPYNPALNQGSCDIIGPENSARELDTNLGWSIANNAKFVVRFFYNENEDDNNVDITCTDSDSPANITHDDDYGNRTNNLTAHSNCYYGWSKEFRFDINTPPATCEVKVTNTSGATTVELCKNTLTIGSAPPAPPGTPVPTMILIDPVCPSEFGGEGVNSAVGCIPIDPRWFVVWILKYFIPIAGGIAFVMLLGGSISLMTAAGNPEKIQKAQQIITSAITGLLFIVFSIYLLHLIGVQIFRIPGFGD